MSSRRTPRFQGAGSSQVNPTRVDVLLDELTTLLGEHRVSFGAGYGIEDTSNDDALLGEAVALAGDADIVVCVLGLPASYESEGYDRTHIELPLNQSHLLTAVLGANPNVVVVLVNGSVVRMSDWVDSVPAIVECWLGGQAAGGAIAEVLTGRTEPGGRLAETFPIRLTDVPSTINFPGDSQHVRYGEGLFIGYRAHDRLGQRSRSRSVMASRTRRSSHATSPCTGRARRGRRLAVDVSVTVTQHRQLARLAGGPGLRQRQRVVGRATGPRAEGLRQGAPRARRHPSAVTIELDQRAFSFWSERTTVGSSKPATSRSSPERARAICRCRSS